MATADSAIQQTTVDDTPRQAGRRERDKDKDRTKTSKSGLQYDEGYPKAIRKTILPTLKQDVDFLFDFGMPNEDKDFLVDDDKILDTINDLAEDSKAPRYWWNTLLEKHNDYERTLRFILNLKATLLNSANANMLKEWRLGDKIKVPPEDSKEVGAISSLYEKEIDNEKIIDTNTKIIRAFILKDDKHPEERKEIILNIALGNLGGLYEELVRRDKGEGKKEEEAV
jgi:hypothetical protein